MVDIWVCFPSLDPDASERTLSHWKNAGFKTAVFREDGVVLPSADLTLAHQTYRTWAQATNEVVRSCIAHGADIVVAAGDDMYPPFAGKILGSDPPPEGPWINAQDFAAMYVERFPSLDGIVQASGDRYGNIDGSAISPLIGRKFVERYYGGKGPYFDGYRHLYADTEMWEFCRREGVYAEIPDVAIYHDHWTRHGRDLLPHAKRQVIRDFEERDRELFVKRKLAGYPGAK